jgi:hypothetical protein
VAEYADAAVKILEQARTREVRLTGLKLVEALMGRGTSNLKLTGWQVTRPLSPSPYPYPYPYPYPLIPYPLCLIQLGSSRAPWLFFLCTCKLYFVPFRFL